MIILSLVRITCEVLAYDNLAYEIWQALTACKELVEIIIVDDESVPPVALTGLARAAHLVPMQPNTFHVTLLLNRHRLYLFIFC